MRLYRWPCSRILRVSTVRVFFPVGLIGQCYTTCLCELGEGSTGQSAVSPAKSRRVVSLVLLLSTCRVGVVERGGSLDRLRRLHAAHAVEIVSWRRRATLIVRAVPGVVAAHPILEDTTQRQLIALRRGRVRASISTLIVSRWWRRAHNVGIRGVARVVRLSAPHGRPRPARDIGIAVGALSSTQ